MNDFSRRAVLGCRRRGSAILGSALLAVGILACLAVSSRAAEGRQFRPEAELISILRSNAPAADKAACCKELALCGTRQCVPALSALLVDERLASWALVALEAIPDPAVEKALREASDRLEGELLAGVLTSLGARRDEKSVHLLEKYVAAPDPQVACAAAWALGHIASSAACKALERALPAASEKVKPVVADAEVRCAESFLEHGNAGEARKVYDQVRAANASEPSVLEATRGAILARRTDGIPLLLEQLRSPDRGHFDIGLRTARELGGREVSMALENEIKTAAPERQSLVLLALADRHDPASLPTVVQTASAGPQKLRLTAIKVLEKIGDVSTVPTLLETAAGSDKELAAAARMAITRMRGAAIDADICTRLSSASGETRQALLLIAGRRRLDKALPLVLASAAENDDGTRAAALQAIGILGGDKEVAALVLLLLKTEDKKGRAEFEDALLEITGRQGASCVPGVLPMARCADAPLRISALKLLASAGGEEALGAVKADLQDQDENVQDEAVRTLSSWPSTWADDAGVAEPLLALAKSSPKENHQVLGLRGYLRFVEVSKQIKESDKSAKVGEVLGRAKRPEEKRLAMSVLRDCPNSNSLDLLQGLTKDSDVADDAYSAVVALASKDVEGASKENRKKALQLAEENASNKDTKKRAKEALAKLSE